MPGSCLVGLDERRTTLLPRFQEGKIYVKLTVDVHKFVRNRKARINRHVLKNHHLYRRQAETTLPSKISPKIRQTDEPAKITWNQRFSVKSTATGPSASFVSTNPKDSSPVLSLVPKIPWNHQLAGARTRSQRFHRFGSKFCKYFIIFTFFTCFVSVPECSGFPTFTFVNI